MREASEAHGDEPGLRSISRTLACASTEKMRKLFFVSSVEAAGLSVWEAAVPARADLRAMDSSMCKKAQSNDGR